VRVVSLLQQSLGSCLVSVHQARAACVFGIVNALLRGQKLTAVGLGRSVGGCVSQKHSIKQVDRLLGNWRLHAEIPVFCTAVANMLLKGARRPLILVDWTDLSPKQMALIAAVPIGGRALPIYFESHPISKYANAKVERNFLLALKRRVVPENCWPIVVTDAGFRNPWFKTVIDIGWDFVGRLGAHVMVSAAAPVTGAAASKATCWLKVRSLFVEATDRPDDLDERLVVATNPITARVVRYKKLPAGRHGSKKVNRKGVHPGSTAYKKYQRREKEPWVLATSLRSPSAREITGLYRRRMEIEETFRDAKSHRFGWSFEDAWSRDLDRLRVLLLVACLALLEQTLIGIVAEQSGLHRCYQANTVRNRRVLSFFVLGGLILASEDCRRLLAYLATDHFRTLRARVAIYPDAGPLDSTEIRGDP